MSWTMYALFFAFVCINAKTIRSLQASSTRCGTDWNNANSKCGTTCTDTDAPCPTNEHCYSALAVAPCPASAPTPTPTPTPIPAAPSAGGSTRCGSGWSDANSRCGTACPDGSSSACPSGQTCYAQLSLSPCSASVPTSDLSGGQCVNHFALTTQQITSIMESSNDLSVYTQHINNALSKFQMDCPLRIAAFLAQVRHETAAMTTFYQPADNGAGAIHMLPYNFRMACEMVYEIQQGFNAAFPSCSNANKCQCGSDQEAGTVIQRPEYAFLTGVWWFVNGSNLLLGSGCGDLRLNSDQGLGSSTNPRTGYYEVSRCIFGNSYDSGLAQRVQYYRTARAVTDRLRASTSSQ